MRSRSSGAAVVACAGLSPPLESRSSPLVIVVSAHRGPITEQRPQGSTVLSAWLGAGPTGHAIIDVYVPA
jgi:hypothetical protein